MVATIKLIPLFLTNCIFKVLSLAITARVLGLYFLAIFPLTLALLHLPDIFGCSSCCCCYRFKYLTLGTPKHMIKLYLIQKGTKTTKQTMRNFLYNNIFWIVNHSIYLSLSLFFVTSAVKSDFVYSLYAVIFSAMIVNFVLVYFQVWRPYKRAQRIELVLGNLKPFDIVVDSREETMIQEEGSKSVLLACCCCCCCSVLVGFVVFLIFILFSS